ncbi:TonB family protein [Spirosoma arcticum]
MSALDYFLKANLYGLLFAGCYWLFLRRHTFLTVNRVYLLLSAVLSLALPLVSLPAQTAETFAVPVGVIALPVSVIATAPVEPTRPDWMLLGICAYGLIALGLLLRLAIQSGRVLRLIQQSNRQPRDGYILVLPRNQTTPTFSFFRYVVLNPADVGNELILQHELVHVRQHHSADVLGLATLRALFWPIITLAFVERALRHVHEFLADNQASSQPDYAHFLVDYTFGVRPDVLTNGFFNSSLLKQRILMLHQRATNRWALGKYALVLPLAFSLLAMTTAREEIAAVVTQARDETITVSGKVVNVAGEPLPGTSVMDGKRLIQTDSKGHFQLGNLQSPATLMFSRLGFESITRKITSSTVLTITLRLSQDTLPAMGATADYKSVKPNPKMPTSIGQDPQTINGQVFTVVEQQPTFPGGIPGLMQYVAKNLRYPAEARQARVQGRVFVQFVVTRTGQIQDLRVLKGIGRGCDEEAVRVVSQMPKWKPGIQNGKPIAVQYNLPIQFAIDKGEDKRTGQVTPPSSKTFNAIVDNHPNARFALYNDVNPKAYSTADSMMRGTRSRQTADARTAYFSGDSIYKKGNSYHIRGSGPLGPLSEERLYIIDGKEGTSDSLKNLDPKTIRSINVLSDTPARAYGKKGENGVVIITTKKP